MARRQVQKCDGYEGVYRVLGAPRQYVVRWSITDPRTGRRLSRERLITATTPREAARRRGELAATLASAAAPQARERYGEHVERCWMPSLVARAKAGDLAPSTVARYASYLDDLILPQWRDWYLDAIELSAVRQWVSELRVAPSTLRVMWSVFRIVMDDACALHGIPMLAWQAIRSAMPRPVPEYAARARHTPGELRRALAVARDDDAGPAIWLMATTLLRACHVLALRWVDLDGDLLRPTMTYYCGHVYPIRRRKAVPRVIRLQPEVVEMLGAHRARMGARGHDVFGDARIFPFWKRWLDHRWRAVQRRAGVPVHGLHSLRRTGHDLAALAGLDDELVMAAAAHSNEAVHRLYESPEVVAQKRDRAEAERIGAVGAAVVALVCGDRRGDVASSSADSANGHK